MTDKELYDKIIESFRKDFGRTLRKEDNKETFNLYCYCSENNKLEIYNKAYTDYYE